MSVARKLLISVIGSVALVTLPSAAAIYHYAKQNMLASEAITLVAETKSLVTANALRLGEAEPSLKSLARILSASLSEKPQADESLALNQLVQRGADHAWRSNRQNFNGNVEAGIFLPPDATLDAEQISLHLRSKRILDVFGASIHSPFSNVWLITPEKTEIIYDHSVPDFVLMMSADTDYTKTPWLSLGSLAENPNRGMRWTPPLFDPVPKSWMVSAVMPIDVNGKFVGTIGHDMYFNNVMPALFQQGQRYLGEEHFLLDTEGNYIESGPWQKVLEANPEKFKPDLTHEPALKKVLAEKLDTKPRAFQQEVTFKGRQYLVIGVVMQPVGWRYFRLVPIDEILAPMRLLFYSLVAMVLLIGVLIGVLVKTSVKRNIIDRLETLARAVRRYGLGELDARANLIGKDEIAKTAQEFDAMADQLKATLEAIPDLLFDVDLEGRYYAAHSPNLGLLAAPKEDLIGRNLRDVLPASAALVSMSALEQANESGFSHGKQFKLTVPDGDLWFELSVAKKITKYGEIPRFIVLSRNVTERKQSENALSESELRWKFAIEGSGDGLWDWNVSTNALFLSKKWKEILGYAEDEIGNTLQEWESRLHPDDKEAALLAVQCAMDNKVESYSSEHRLLCEDGHYKWMLDRGMVISRNANGEPLRMIGTIADITSRKLIEQQLKQNEEDLQTIFIHSPDGIVIFDHNHVISHVNELFCKMTGYSEQKLLGCTESQFNIKLQKLCDQRLASKSIANLQRNTADIFPILHIDEHLANKATAPQIIEIIKPSYRILQHTLIEFNQQRISSFIRFRDITGEALVDRMKSEFLMTAAHELRTPMTIILGYVELLKSREFDKQARAGMLDSIHDQSQSIVHLLDELLDLARIEACAGKAFNLAMLPLAPIIENVANNFRVLDDPRHVVVAPMPALPDLLIDQEKIAHALRNCLSNAFKYSPNHGEVSVDVTVVQAALNSVVAIRITDHGIGMTPEQLAHVFEKFYRADTSGKIPGTGLGLSLVKEIMEHHGGQVQVESHATGTLVTLTLPIPNIGGLAQNV